MTLLAALLLAQAPAAQVPAAQVPAAAPTSPAAEFFPLAPGARRTYEVKDEFGTHTLTDVVGTKPVFFDDQPAMGIVQRNQFNETLGTLYYRVDGATVAQVGAEEDRSAATPNVGGPIDLTQPVQKRRVLMRLSPAMPVFKYEGKETAWTYGAVPVLSAVGDSAPIQTDKTFIKGTAKPGPARDVLGRKVDTIEVRAEVQLGEGRLTTKVVQTSVYGRGVGLVESQSKTTLDGKTREQRMRLVAIEGG